MNDWDLIRQYVGAGSESAFAELVRRHLDLVYSAAWRRLGEAHAAQEVAQAVFCLLAQKAARLGPDVTLGTWLYTAACHKSREYQRTEHRRRKREQEAAVMQEIHSDDAQDAWSHLAPLLDDAMLDLRETDRRAVVLRFFERKPLREVGLALGLPEDAARKRVDRAVERLRAFFARRGVEVSAPVLATVVAAHAVQAAPTGLAAGLASASLTAGAAGASGLLSTLTHALIMTKTTATVLAVLVIGATVTPLLLKHPRAPAPVAPANPSPVVTSPARAEPPPAPRPGNAAARQSPKPTQPSLLARVAQLPPLTANQIENYVEQNKRNAESLLAAYRIGTNLAYLTEAATRYPNDPEVQYAVIAARVQPEVQRQWIDAYKVSSPDNALAWYFSALEHFKAGETAQALQDLAEATRKPAFRAELAPTLQAVEELNLSAGRAADEAKVAAFQACAQVPHLQPMRDLAKVMQTTAQQYRQQGDTASAESLAGMGLMLGSHLSAGGGSQTVINQLVGIAIEKLFLQQLDAQGKDSFGRPVAEVSAAVAQHQATLKGFAQTMSGLTSQLSDAEWANYTERVKLYGEESALMWLKARHESP